MVTEAEVEAGARVLHARNSFVPWERVTEPARQAYHLDAKAVLEAAAKARWQPIEPSQAMLDAARDWSLQKYGKPIGNDAARGCWNAMYAALQPLPPAPSQVSNEES